MPARRSTTLRIALVAALALGLAPVVAHAEPSPPGLRPQLQLDGGLSVIGAGYEQPLARHLAVQLEAVVFGTYFLPWFDAGDTVVGAGGGIRPIWFVGAGGRGLYVAPYLRIIAVDSTSFTGASAVGVTAGAFLGWAFRLSTRLDLRLGIGAQYIRFGTPATDGARAASTPFAALDAVLGYRL